MSWRGVQAGEIPAMWPRIVERISSAAMTARGKYWPQDVFEDLLAGTNQLWLWESATAHALVISEIHTYKRNKVCGILICVGENSAEWAQPLLSVIERWAKAHGCDAMEIVARPGWKKAFPDYQMTHIFLEKALT